MGGWVDGWVGGKAGLRIAYSNQKWPAHIWPVSPGPASSVVERSLRKIFVRGDRGSIPVKGCFFSGAINSHSKLRTIIPTTWTGSSNLATSTRKSCCSISYHRAKRNVAWINRSYDIIFMCWGDVIYPTTQTLQRDQQPEAVSLRVMKLTAGNQQRWLKSNASGQDMG